MWLLIMTIVSSLYHPKPHIIIIDRYPTETQCKEEIKFLEAELQTVLVYKQVIKFKCHPVRYKLLFIEEEEEEDDHVKRQIAESEK